MCVVVCLCVPAKLCERQRCIWGIQTNPSFQPQCFVKPISEIGVRCRGTVFISSTISLHHTAPLPSPLHPQHSQPFRPFSVALSSELRQKKQDRKTKEVHLHHTRMGTSSKQSKKIQASKITIEKNTHHR